MAALGDSGLERLCLQGLGSKIQHPMSLKHSKPLQSNGSTVRSLEGVKPCNPDLDGVSAWRLYPREFRMHDGVGGGGAGQV